jgi:uncharacterized protein with FMN-binding domain
MSINYPLLMRKGLVIIFTVALLGLVGAYNSKNDANARPSAHPATSNARPASTNQSQNTTTTGSHFKDGSYKGSAAETPYGTVQVSVTISGGKISDVHFIQMPNDQRHSREVTRDSEPLLLQSTLAKQRADVDFVTGATSTVYGYRESLQAALDKSAGSTLLPTAHYQDA